jgi:hypothetical protein
MQNIGVKDSGFWVASLFFITIIVSSVWPIKSVTWLFNGGHLYLLPTLLSLVLLYRCLVPRTILNRREMDILLLLFVLLFVNTLYSQNVLVSLVANLEFYCLIAVMLIIRYERPSFFKHFTGFLLATCLLIAYIGLLMYLVRLNGYSGPTFLGRPWNPSLRMVSIIDQPNLLATWMNIGLVLLVTRFRPNGKKHLAWVCSDILLCFCLRSWGQGAAPTVWSTVRLCWRLSKKPGWFLVIFFIPGGRIMNFCIIWQNTGS